MNLPYRARPGLGFTVLVATTIGAAFFFVWGLRTPPLEHIWQMQLELLLGDRDALSPAEEELLQDVLERYPGLADNMLEDADSGLISANLGGVVDRGYAYVVRRTATAAKRLVVGSPTGAKLKLQASIATVDTQGVASGTAPFVWSLPDEGPFPQLIGLRLLQVEETAAPAAPEDSLTVAGGAVGRSLPPMRVEVLAGS